VEEGWLKFALGWAGRVVLFEYHSQLVNTVLPGRLKNTMQSVKLLTQVMKNVFSFK
jgi:hypothetical protein